MEKKNLYEIADHFLVITFAQLLHMEGITSKNIESYTKDELKTLLVTHEKLRGKNTIGIGTIGNVIGFYEWERLVECLRAEKKSYDQVSNELSSINIKGQFSKLLNQCHSERSEESRSLF